MIRLRLDGGGSAMDRLILAGRMLFAISMIGLGVEHFVFHEFITGRAPPWPEGLTGGTVWAYVGGLIVVATSAAIMLGRYGRPAALLLASLIFIWAVLRHIPVVIASDVLSPDYTAAVKALAFFGGALATAATFPTFAESSRTPIASFMNRDSAFMLAGTLCLAVFMVNNGIQHFIYTSFVASLIPAWFPGNAVFWTYFSSVCLFAGAVGMLYRRTAYLAALLTGIMVFAWVWIVHVPRTFVSVSDTIAVFEAPAIAGIALLLAGWRRQQSQSERASAAHLNHASALAPLPQEERGRAGS
jgi:uncharacterized membrane protein